MSLSTLTRGQWIFVPLVFLHAQPLPGADPAKDDAFRGKVEASTTVVIRPRVAGTLTQVLVKDGSLVKQGEVLAKLDTRPFEAEVELAKAQMAVAEAKLRATEAERSRAMELFKKGAMSREEFNRTEAGANVAKASLAVAEATLRKAMLELDSTQIIAPIDGRIGQFAVDPGNQVAAGAEGTKLATIIRSDPVYVDFAIDQSTLTRLRKNGVEFSASKPVSIAVGDDDAFAIKGVIESAGSSIEADGTLRIRAVVANPKGELIPGITVRVRLEK